MVSGCFKNWLGSCDGQLKWGVLISYVKKLSVLSSFQASPCQGHLDQVLHTYGYIKHRPQLILYLDPTKMHILENKFKENSHELIKQYHDAKQLVPHDATKPRGHRVRIKAYIDSGHTASKTTDYF
jgi:hypothetical protein